MAQQLYFSRDTKMFLEFQDYIWTIPVLDGFSFSQATNSTEVTLNEMESTGGISRRGRRAFNDSLAPGEWSFSTYVRPFTSDSSYANPADSAAEVHAVEEVLWAIMMGAKQYNASGKYFENTGVDVGQADLVSGECYKIKTAGSTNWTGIGAGAGSVGTVFVYGGQSITGAGGVVTRLVNNPGTAGNGTKFSFHASQSSTLGTANIYFVLGDATRKVMKLTGVTVNEASIDFDIDGIATINWSGNSSEVIDFTGSTIEATSAPAVSAATQDAVGTIAVGDVFLDSDNSYKLQTVATVPGSGNVTLNPFIDEATTSTTNFIRNRLTTLTVEPTSTDPDSDGTAELESSYNLTLTGGSITISNNNTYITPEEIGLVNVPIGHVTGTRNTSGSFTCYLTEDTGATNASSDFFEDLRAITNVVTNSFKLTFKIGGASGTGLEVEMPTCHVEVPTHGIEDIISLETNFMALPSSITGSDEMSLKYRP